MRTDVDGCMLDRVTTVFVHVKLTVLVDLLLWCCYTVVFVSGLNRNVAKVSF